MHLHHNEQLYNHPHPRFVRKIIEVLDCFISGVEQTLRTLSFFFTFFFQNVFWVKRRQESQLTVEHCYLPKTFLVGDVLHIEIHQGHLPGQSAI